MATLMQRVGVVRVNVTTGRSGLFFAESDDLRGLLVAEHTMDALLVAVPNAIRDLYAAQGQEVIVTPARMENEPFPFAAIPAAILEESPVAEAVHQ